MKNKNKNIIIGILSVILLMFLVSTFGRKQFLKQSETDNQIDNIKKENGYEGENDIYQVQKGDDNIEILTIKPSVQFMVAFSGMIKNKMLTLEEANEIFQSNYKNNTGIYIEPNSQDKFMDFLENEKFKNKYYLDERGYLQIKNESNELSEYDKIIVDCINSNQNYIVDISSICYIVDDITGKILKYDFEQMDKYQIFEYFEDENKTIIFLTENKENILSKNEIIDELISLFAWKINN